MVLEPVGRAKQMYQQTVVVATTPNNNNINDIKVKGCSPWVACDVWDVCVACVFVCRATNPGATSGFAWADADAASERAKVKSKLKFRMLKMSQEYSSVVCVEGEGVEMPLPTK